MIRSSFPPQAATRSFYFVAVLSVIAFAHGTDYDCAGSPRQTRAIQDPKCCQQ
jgi:hypothetical protein